MKIEELIPHVNKQLDEYVYFVPTGSLGTALPNEYIEKHLNQLRASLVVPYMVAVKMEQPFALFGTDQFETRSCAVVADDDEGNLLVFDFLKDEFLVAQLFNGTINSIGVRGDAIGCFIAR